MPILIFSPVQIIMRHPIVLNLKLILFSVGIVIGLFANSNIIYGIGFATIMFIVTGDLFLLCLKKVEHPVKLYIFGVLTVNVFKTNMREFSLSKC